MNYKKTKIFVGTLFALAILLTVGLNLFVYPKQPPTPRALLQLEKDAVNKPELMNNNFDNSIGNLTLLDPINSNPLEIKESKLIIKNSPNNSIWFSDTSGVFAYQNVSGNFMLETQSISALKSDHTKRSNSTYSSAGIIVRDASSKSGQMKWLAYNQGYQDQFYGTELKTTTPQNSQFGLDNILGNSSQSNWFSNKIEGESNELKQRVCKVGKEFRFYTFDIKNNKWVEEMWNDQTVTVGENKNPEVTKGNPIRITRQDLSDTLQVGLMSNDGSNGGLSISKFNYINYTKLSDFQKCEMN
jgi:hypothetical protein